MADIRHQMIEKIWKGKKDKEDTLIHTMGGRLLKDIILISRPPSGMCRILNVYWDPLNEKAVFKYEDEPVE